MTKLTPDIKDFIDAQIKSKEGLKYSSLADAVARRFGVRISKSTISKRAKALKLELQRGRKRLVPAEKGPARSIFLDCAGAFFLKGAELETGVLPAMNQLLVANSESTQARKVLRLAQQINAFLLYAPVFGLKTAQDIADYNQQGLLYLTEQKGLPGQQEITQYLHYLTKQELLLLIIKEVTKTCAEALSVRIDFAEKTFYLDAQARTVWPNPKVPRDFSATLSKTKGYIKDIFQFPLAQRPLVLQVAPGYTFLPQEVFNLIYCFEGAQEEGISRIIVKGKAGETLAFWQGVKPIRGKYYFIFPLSPWQYSRLQGTQIVRSFQEYRIGPEGETMAVADAEINLFDSQLHKNIRLRAALVRRKDERLALVSNISRREERYIRRIAEQYFSRWPARPAQSGAGGPEAKVKTYYDLLEEAHQEALLRSHREVDITPLPTMSYRQRPEEAFRFFLEHLHRYALRRFFPAEDEQETLKSMREKFYSQSGYLRDKRGCREIFLRPFSQKEFQKNAQIACQRFNQSGLEFPPQKSLRIYLL